MHSPAFNCIKMAWVAGVGGTPRPPGLRARGASAPPPAPRPPWAANGSPAPRPSPVTHLKAGKQDPPTLRFASVWEGKKCFFSLFGCFQRFGSFRTFSVGFEERFRMFLDVFPYAGANFKRGAIFRVFEIFSSCR